jgi:hypothetical protein
MSFVGVECGSVLRMVKECENSDRVGFDVDAIEDDEWRPRDPGLVDAAVVEVLAGMRVSGKELEKEGIDSGKRALGYDAAEMIDAVLKLTGVPPRRAQRGRPSCPLEIEARSKPAEGLIAIDDFATLRLRHALIQLSAMRGRQPRVEGLLQQSSLLDMLEQLTALGERELGNELDDMCLRLRHTNSLPHMAVSCTRRANASRFMGFNLHRVVLYDCRESGSAKGVT